MNFNQIVLYLLGICILILIIITLKLKHTITKYKKHTLNGLDNDIEIRNNVAVTLDAELTEKRKQLSDLNFDICTVQVTKQRLENDIGRIGEQIKSAQEAAKQAAESQINSQKQYIDEQLEIYRKATQQQKSQIDEQLNAYKAARNEAIELELKNRADELRQNAQKEQDDWVAANLLKRAELLEQTQVMQSQFEEILLQLEDYKNRRQKINEEILRERELKEQQDFYRIILNESDKEDINYLIGIMPNIRNKEVLSKLIWSEYLQKPFNQMLKNVLGNTSPKNVIYMIKNITSGEIYIGKTKGEVSKRWTEHIKTSLNIGTIKRSKIHDNLYNNWDNFTFSILDKINEDQDLGEREKYYIKFYESNVYGYNIASGG